VTQDDQNQHENEGVLRPKESLQTGVLETGGTGLYHGDDKFGTPPEIGETPTDVSEADPFDTVPTAGVSSDGGSGMDDVGMAYEYPDGELLEPEEQ